MNKKLLRSWGIAIPMSLLLGLSSPAQVCAQQTPAFPGAEGFGRYVTGGRGGKVYHVTSLEDSGNGTLRWALKQPGPKTIVFDVSGYIDLKKQLEVTSNTTIAGQTAPGDGITLRYYTLSFNKCDNVIVRFIRSRRSQLKDVNDGADAVKGNDHKNIIIDHCSFSWSIDEVASFYDNLNFTMQWCNITEALANPGHSKGEHSYGGIWGGKGASFHHNLIAHVQNRAPRFNGARYKWEGYDKEKYENTVQAERVDFRNCVMYNWGKGNGCYGGPGGGYVNIVNNYYKAGPATANKKRITEVSVGEPDNSTPTDLCGYASRYHISGNYVTAASSPENYDWQGVKYDDGLFTINGEKYIADAAHLYGEHQTYVKNDDGTDCIRLKLDEPIDAGEVTTHKAQTAYEKVLAYSGASLVRDACDIRYAEEAKSGTTTFKGSVVKLDGILDIINDPEGEENPTTASFPNLREEKRPANYDTDADGVPDEWETANGMNPSDADDSNAYTIDTKGYYTNLEVYLNSIVETIMKAGNSNAENAVDEYFPTFTPTSGIADIRLSLPIVKTTYSSVAGTCLPDSTKGLLIKTDYFADGSKRTNKFIK